MAVTDDRKYTKKYICELLDSRIGRTLGEVDESHQFDRAVISPKITGIAGDVIEQSVFKYARDSRQECDIEVDGLLTELKTTGVRIPKKDIAKANGKTGDEYNVFLKAKEGISITAVTFEPTYQEDFQTSHFWEKSERLLIVFYEYKSYTTVPALEYAKFPIVDYCFNSFSEEEQKQLRNDWEIVRDYLKDIYNQFPSFEERYEHLIGFTHILRPNLLLIELVPGFKKTEKDYQKPRYRLKKTFVDYIVQGHFSKTRESSVVSLKQSFSSFAQLDSRCHSISIKYKGKNLEQLKTAFTLDIKYTNKDFVARCVLAMFDAECKQLNQIADFNKAGIIAKTITTTPKGCRTEDMKLSHIDFEEWANKDIEFADSEVYNYFCEHSFLCPVFCERGDLRKRQPNETKEEYKRRIETETKKTTFEGFKRFSFEDSFIEQEVYRTWKDSREQIFDKTLKWEFKYKNGERRKNNSGSYMGAPNFPKSKDYIVFFRGGENDSREEARSVVVNDIHMLPQFFWIKGSYIADKLKQIEYL